MSETVESQPEPGQPGVQPGQPGPQAVLPPSAPVEVPASVVAEVLAGPRRGRLRQVMFNSLIVMALLLLAGGAGVGLYVKSVGLPEPLSFAAHTTLYYSDGKTVLAELGDVRRTAVPVADLVDEVKQAAVAADDPDFYRDSGGPIARAVARSAFDLRGTSASTRARVVISARKLEDKYAKDTVLGMYLNNSSFGRDTFGVDAAAREYFGKTADKKAVDVAALTTAEAMVLVAMLRQPEPDPADPQGSPGYDPTRGATAERNSRDRFTTITASMVALKYLTTEQAAGLAYPTNVRPYDEAARRAPRDRPTGIVVNQVLSELTRSPYSPFKGVAWQAIRDGGYSIVTTIDARAQGALERAADGKTADSALAGQPANLRAAAVLVEPGTGRVLGYFGGNDGRGTDYAGIHEDATGTFVGSGAHPAGGTFEVHTLAAALRDGISVRSQWDASLDQVLGGRPIRNESTCMTVPASAGRPATCSLADSSLAGLRSTFYAVTLGLSAKRVIEMARDAGVSALWTDSRDRVELSELEDVGSVTPSRFDASVGIGQYPVTVLDQANAMATYAAGGVAAQAHFVTTVRRRDAIVYSERLPGPTQPKVLIPQAIADLDWTLSRNEAGKLTGRDSASQNGSWPLPGSQIQNADAWEVGYTRSLAMAVWIGDVHGTAAIKDASGATIWGAGLPATIYRNVMNVVHDQLGLSPAAFAPPAFIGTVNPPGAVTS